MGKKIGPLPDWPTWLEACRYVVLPDGKTQSSAHIRRMHWHVAGRLVMEGGLHPQYLKPRPPLKVRRFRKASFLEYDQDVANASESTVFGGLKTKAIDVTFTLPDIGPCIAVSMKATTKALRNLTNRMEEAVGDCTNIHIAYPALVYAFLHVIRANRAGPPPESARDILDIDERTGELKPADLALTRNGSPTPGLVAYHDALARLSGRRDLRDDPSRYEAATLFLVSPDDSSLGKIVDNYPANDSPLRLGSFFQSIYNQYDLRFVYGAPSLRPKTRRHYWHPDSDAFGKLTSKDFEFRLAEEDVDPRDLIDLLPISSAESGETESSQ